MQSVTGSRNNENTVVPSSGLEALRELFADAPEMAKTALENLIRKARTTPSPPPPESKSAGRVGRRVGKVSELTVIAPMTPAGARRLRAVLNAMNGSFQAADLVGTLHDMRFVLLDNDTKVLFATAYDGDWDSYINDFATKIPDQMDLIFSNIGDWPGIRSPKVKDVIAKYQITSDAWYVGNPNLTVVETRRLERISKALDEFLDKISS